MEQVTKSKKKKNLMKYSCVTTYQSSEYQRCLLCCQRNRKKLKKKEKKIFKNLNPVNYEGVTTRQNRVPIRSTLPKFFIWFTDFNQSVRSQRPHAVI